jgi:hypothetical protein
MRQFTDWSAALRAVVLDEDAGVVWAEFNESLIRRKWDLRVHFEDLRAVVGGLVTGLAELR